MLISSLFAHYLYISLKYSLVSLYPLSSLACLFFVVLGVLPSVVCRLKRKFPIMKFTPEWPIWYNLKQLAIFSLLFSNIFSYFLMSMFLSFPGVLCIYRLFSSSL
ncbi:hypothetical protein BDW74DRAFT_85810 [Aspergillus multicolor]|uniref:uncharacterized protein n=1 Tax=Aspergillus multicolor TaxID=41759 RepID=UPI003CCE28BF